MYADPESHNAQRYRQGRRQVFTARWVQMSEWPQATMEVGWDTPSPPGVWSGEEAVTPPQKMFGLLLLKWCILTRSERVYQQCAAHVI